MWGRLQSPMLKIISLVSHKKPNIYLTNTLSLPDLLNSGDRYTIIQRKLPPNVIVQKATISIESNLEGSGIEYDWMLLDIMPITPPPRCWWERSLQ